MQYDRNTFRIQKLQPGSSGLSCFSMKTTLFNLFTSPIHYLPFHTSIKFVNMDKPYV